MKFTKTDHGKTIKAYRHHGDMPTTMKLIGRLKEDEYLWFAYVKGFVQSHDVYTVKFDKFGDRIWKIVDDNPLGKK